MPGFNGIGPNGQGPRTGRGFGPCGQGLGRGMGQRMGGGMGYRGYRAPITSNQEKEILTEDMNFLQKEIEAIKERIEELGSKK